MKKKFDKALEKISSELINMPTDEYIAVIKTHKNSEYAEDLKNINFFLPYKLQKKMFVSFEIPKTNFKVDEYNYRTTSTKEIKIKNSSFKIEIQKWLTLAAAA